MKPKKSLFYTTVDCTGLGDTLLQVVALPHAHNGRCCLDFGDRAREFLHRTCFIYADQHLRPFRNGDVIDLGVTFWASRIGPPKEAAALIVNQKTVSLEQIRLPKAIGVPVIWPDGQQTLVTFSLTASAAISCSSALALIQDYLNRPACQPEQLARESLSNFLAVQFSRYGAQLRADVNSLGPLQTAGRLQEIAGQLTRDLWRGGKSLGVPWLKLEGCKVEVQLDDLEAIVERTNEDVRRQKEFRWELLKKWADGAAQVTLTGGQIAQIVTEYIRANPGAGVEELHSVTAGLYACAEQHGAGQVLRLLPKMLSGGALPEKGG